MSFDTLNIYTSRQHIAFKKLYPCCLDWFFGLDFGHVDELNIYICAILLLVHFGSVCSV